MRTRPGSLLHIILIRIFCFLPITFTKSTEKFTKIDHVQLRKANENKRLYYNSHELIIKINDQN